MIHVGVAQADGSRGQDRPWTETDIEGHIQFRDMDHGLFTGDTDSLDAVRREKEEAQLPLSGRRLWKHGENLHSRRFHAARGAKGTW
jgi:hypothetical protein